MQLAEHVWNQHASNINHGFVDKVILDPVVEMALGSDGLALIAERFQSVPILQCLVNQLINFRSMIQAPVKINKQGPHPTEIYPVGHRNGHEKVAVIESKVKAKAEAKKDKIARPPNAFILYRQHHHPLVKSQNPELHNNQICKSSIDSFPTTFTANIKIAIMLGKQWQNETADIKGQFKSMAEEIKKKHLNAHPTYQYQPRKPAEKKRRMTRRKAEKLSAEAVKSCLPINATIVPEFEKTSTGNGVFTLGDDSIDDATLLAMVQKHNEDVMTFTNNYNDTAAPVIFHERSEEAQNDTNFYANTLNFDGMYPTEPGANELLPMDAKALAVLASADYQTFELAFDHKSEQLQKAELTRELAQLSTLWTPTLSDEEMSSFENGF
ncbi:MAG: hypothetical protein Q9182_000714 [Xanthomendoza sp. 2 TL-2023]